MRKNTQTMRESSLKEPLFYQTNKGFKGFLSKRHTYFTKTDLAQVPSHSDEKNELQVIGKYTQFNNYNRKLFGLTDHF